MRQPTELGPYTEGVNLVDPPIKLSPNELSSGTNWRTGVRGDFYKRPGYGIYGATSTQINGANFVNLDLRYYKSDGTKKRVSAAGGVLKFGDDTLGTWTNISINGTGASMSSTNLADWMVYKNRLYITDGVAVQRYNGTDDIFAGHPIPGAATLAQTTGGSLTLLGVYKYFVTYVANATTGSEMGEGPKGSEASITLTGSNNKVNLTNIPVAASKHEVSSRRIYRTQANGSVFYFLTEIADNTTTTYSDTTSDTTLALNAAFVATQIPPADARYVIMGHDERAYWFGMSGTNASLVYVSEVGFPDRIISATGFFPVSNNDGDIITGGALVPGGIIFFKRNSMWLLRAFGFGLINIRPKEKKGSGVGTLSHFSAVSTPIGLIFLSQQNQVFKFDGSNIDEIGRKISSEFSGLTQTGYSRLVAAYHDKRYIISYDYRGLYGYNRRTLEYDTVAGKWDGPHENSTFYTPSYYSVWDSAFDKGELGWGESNPATGSFVYTRTEFTQTDRGNKFASRATSGGRPSNLAEIASIKAFVHAEMSGDTYLTFTHIDEFGKRTSVNLGSYVPTTGSILGGTDVLGTTFILGGSAVAQVWEGSLGPCRSRVPIYEISDGGNSTRAKMNSIQLLVEPLPLK